MHLLCYYKTDDFWYVCDNSDTFFPGEVYIVAVNRQKISSSEF